MGLKLRCGFIVCLMLAAAVSVCGTYSSISRGTAHFLPAEVYAELSYSAAEAEFFLRPCGDYVAVYSSKHRRKPINITQIELSALRAADRALIEKGIPVSDNQALLYLLEDLGS